MIKKQISLFLPVDEWKLIRLEAARTKKPMTALIREWIAKDLQEVKERANDADAYFEGWEQGRDD